MPRILKLTAITPVNVSEATEAFGSELRVNLIRHYRESPGPQKAAAEALGVATQAVSHNTRILIEAGIVYVESAADRRAQICCVNQQRLEELLAALTGYMTGNNL